MISDDIFFKKNHVEKEKLYGANDYHPIPVVLERKNINCIRAALLNVSKKVRHTGKEL